MRCLFRVFILVSLYLMLTTLSFAEQIKYEQTSAAGFSYELSIETETPEVMKPLPVSLRITDNSGKQISGGQIKCSLTMPAMAMPSNNPPIKESDQSGFYKGVFLLTMGGLWHAELSLSCCEGRTDNVVIPIPGVISDDKDNGIDNKLEDLFHEKKS